MQSMDDYTFLLQPSRRRQLIRQVIMVRLCIANLLSGVGGLLYTFLTTSTPIYPLSNYNATLINKKSLNLPNYT